MAADSDMCNASVGADKSVVTAIPLAITHVYSVYGATGIVAFAALAELCCRNWIEFGRSLATPYTQLWSDCCKLQIATAILKALILSVPGAQHLLGASTTSLCLGEEWLGTVATLKVQAVVVVAQLAGAEAVTQPKAIRNMVMQAMRLATKRRYMLRYRTPR